MWIFFTFLAAAMQAWRNAFQSQLSQEVNVVGVTLARFLWASPIAICYLLALYLWKPTTIPSFNGSFLFYVIGASCMQIFATGLMVRLFKMKDYAIGAGLAKSEAMMAAILGVLFFGTHLTLLAWAGVLIGAVAVFLLSCPQGIKKISLDTAITGVICGSAFALTSLWIREASLCLDIPFPHRAAWVLVSVIGLQTIMLLIYIKLKEPQTLSALLNRPKLTLLTSITSCIGSIGWFSAMSLQAVPYVKTLGQVEIFFTMLIAVFWLKQKLKIKDFFALLLIAIASILVMWG